MQHPVWKLTCGADRVHDIKYTQENSIMHVVPKPTLNQCNTILGVVYCRMVCV